MTAEPNRKRIRKRLKASAECREAESARPDGEWRNQSVEGGLVSGYVSVVLSVLSNFESKGNMARGGDGESADSKCRKKERG